jgi:hypothetical protein
LTDWDVSFTVPMIPRSVNTYTRHCIVGGRIRRFVQKDALSFIDAVRTCCGGQSVAGKSYEVRFIVHEGKGARGDIDNRAKLVLDGLVKAGVIHSDSAITDLSMAKRKDRENPRTEIFVRKIA